MASLFVGNKSAVCFLVTKPTNKETFNFVKTFLNTNQYDVYICIDDNLIEIPEEWINSSSSCDGSKPKINIIRKKEGECERDGFKGSVCYTLDRACSRDKALWWFYFSSLSYESVWFFEEDVFIPSIQAILNLDKKYSPLDFDLLSSKNCIKRYENDPEAPHWQHWFRNKNKIDYPWAHSLICAVRVSNKLIDLIGKFALKNKFLLFDELLFNTLALQAGLKIATPEELSTITFSFRDTINLDDDIQNHKEWAYDENKNIVFLNENFLYHPVRNIKNHEIFRKIMFCV